MLDIWRFHQPDVAAVEWSAIDLNAGGDCLIVLRSDLSVRIDRVEDAEWTLLRAVASGASVAQLLARLDAHSDVHSDESPDKVKETRGVAERRSEQQRGAGEAAVLDSIQLAFASGWITGAERT